MRKLLLIPTVLYIMILSCRTEIRNGTVIIKEITSLDAGQRYFLDRSKYPSFLKDTLILRFRGQFMSDSIAICIGDSCLKKIIATTNLSIAYATAVPLSIKENHDEFKIFLRGLIYCIPIKKEFFFLDVNVDSLNILTATYTNEILKLS